MNLTDVLEIIQRGQLRLETGWTDDEYVVCLHVPKPDFDYEDQELLEWYRSLARLTSTLPPRPPGRVPSPLISHCQILRERFVDTNQIALLYYFERNG